MLTNDELTAIRADVVRLLPDTCNLLTIVRTPDGQGGFTEAWGTATGGTAVPCRLDYVRGVKVVIGGALQPFSGWMLTLPYDATITTAYRVQHNSHNYAVIGEDVDKSWKASVRAPVEAL
jgi:head-tail adaptor